MIVTMIRKQVHPIFQLPKQTNPENPEEQEITAKCLFLLRYSFRLF